MLNIPGHYAQTALPPLANNQIALDLAQARQYRKAHPALADSLYKKVEEALLEIAERENVQPLAASEQTLLKEREERSETLQQAALRRYIADVYVEHGEVLGSLHQAEQAKACYEQAQAWSHLHAAAQLNLALPATGPRLSLSRQSSQPTYYVDRPELAELFGLLKTQKNAVIEVMGPVGAGKTALLQRLSHSGPDPFFKDYDLLAWIDCRSVSTAHTDIQAISHVLGSSNLNFKDALKKVANYIAQHSKSLLILDGVASHNVELIASWLKPLSGSCQIIYTATQPLSSTLRECLGRPIEAISLKLFNADQASQLVQQCLPEEPPLTADDSAKIIQITGGHPSVIRALCQHYQTMSVSCRGFSAFLAQPHKHQGKRDVLLGEIAKASLELLEKQALNDHAAARAVILLKQAAGLGDHPIPFAFFVDEQQQVDFPAIQILYDKKLALLEIDRDAENLKLNSAFVSAMQKQFASEQQLLLEKNIRRLSEVFSYLTNNEGKQGRNSRPTDIERYADLVDTLLFETCAKPSSPEHQTSLLSQTLASHKNGLTLLSQALALGSSLARLYYLHHGALQLAYERLDKAKSFFKLGLSEELITSFEKLPASLTSSPIREEEVQLLKLYSQEYLYQTATIASQLMPRGQVPASVVQNFEKSYAIQVNLGEHVDPAAIAYTLCNFTRALRKQHLLVDALEKYGELEKWMELHSDVFDENTRAKLLVDQGIIKKEAEDAKPNKAERNYIPALEMLLHTRDVYLRHQTANQRRNMGMLSIYLGEAYLAAGEFELGIQHTCQILHYDRARHQARAYSILARAFDEANYGALAKLFIDKAEPLQIDAYKATAEALRRKIDGKLLERYQQTKSLVPINQWKEQTDLTEYCEKSLVDSSAPSQRLLLQQIENLEEQAYNWLWRHHDKTNRDAKRIENAKKLALIESAKKEEADRLNLQREQDKLWYEDFAQRTKLVNADALSFAKQFKEKLGEEILQQLREAYGEPTPMGTTELAVGLGQAFPSLVPQIQLDPASGVVPVIDLPSVIQGITKPLGERARRQQKAKAHHAADALKKPEQQSKSLQLYRSVKPEIDEMADYAARCWQPIFAEHTWSEQDIQALVEDGVQRLMDYLKAGKGNEHSIQERIVFALMTGEGSKRLSVRKEEAGKAKGHWTTQGFFAKPGIKIEAEKKGEKIYFPSTTKAHPGVYGYRFGSTTEGRVGPPLYTGPFESEAKASDKAKEARGQRCVVM